MRNERDIKEIDERYTKGLAIHYVEDVDQVLDLALLKQKVKDPLQFSFDEADQKM